MRVLLGRGVVLARPWVLEHSVFVQAGKLRHGAAPSPAKSRVVLAEQLEAKRPQAAQFVPLGL